MEQKINAENRVIEGIGNNKNGMPKHVNRL